MTHFIDKDRVVAEIRKMIKNSELYIEHHRDNNDRLCYSFKHQRLAMCELLSFIDTLEVKEVNTWHLQEKEDIYNAVKGWSLQTFVCVMKDGSIQKFIGNLDEDYEGNINVHIDGINDDYDDVDDIVKWIELT